MAFIGMSRREDYLATKVIKDRFLALDKTNGIIYTWSNITGKLLRNVMISRRQSNQYIDFSIYEAQSGD